MKKIRLKQWKPGDRLRLKRGNNGGKGVVFLFEKSECLEDDVEFVMPGQTGTLREPTEGDLKRISIDEHSNPNVRIMAWVLDEHPGEGKYDAIVFTNDSRLADSMEKMRARKT